MIDINKPIPVTEAQYKVVYKSWNWAAATRIDENGQHWIWIWIPKQANKILEALNIVTNEETSHKTN